ncbi:hypothetical protein ACHAQH_002996 [Verticillium albo-atrum]
MYISSTPIIYQTLDDLCSYSSYSWDFITSRMMALSKYLLYLLQATASPCYRRRLEPNDLLHGVDVLLTPGLPVYASNDLTNWRLASHAVSRKSQVPEHDESLTQNDGLWAATIRYHEGTFYITDPYDAAWGNPIRYEPEQIDPDIFWDDDGQAYVATAGTNLQTLDLATGTFGPVRRIWNGTSDDPDAAFLEGPHIYKKDGIFEGIPVLTNRNTTEYFQNIGHGDLFQDSKGQWWSSALAWRRSGPAGVSYPMGREMVITPVTWDEGAWPVFVPVRGEQTAWALATDLEVGVGALVTDPDVVDFAPGSSLALRFLAPGVLAAKEDVPAPVTKGVPQGWEGHPIRLSIRASNETHYSFFMRRRAQCLMRIMR